MSLLGNHKIACTFMLLLTLLSVKKIIFYLIGLMLIIACEDEKKESENIDQELSFSNKTIEKSLDNCSPEEGECTFISLTFPVAKNAEYQAANINRNIEQFLLNTIDYQDEGGLERPEELAENFIENYKETAAEFPEYELPWEATINGNILFEGPEVICIRFKTNMFTGGAHGYSSTNYLNFNRNSGKKLSTASLFTPEFRSFVEEDFRTKHNIPMDSNINSTGMFFENDEFHLPANIGITENEIILHYNAYEIAPYAAGNFILTYKKNEIEEFLKISVHKKQA